jgi:hypothetical protein
MTSLETRYRRLLAFYPREHRQLYGEEMLGVLMAGATPGRSRPSLPELTDLIGSALAVRLRRAAGASADEHWRRAAYTAMLIGALLLLTGSGYRVVGSLSLSLNYHGIGDVAPTRDEWVRLIARIFVLTAGLLRWRRLTALCAVVAAAIQYAQVAAGYAASPVDVLYSGALLTVATMVAALALWLIRAERQPRPRSLWLLGTAGALLVGWAATVWLSWPRRDLVLEGIFGVIIIFGSAAVLTWWRQPAAERPRLLAFGVPVVAMGVLVQWGFAGFELDYERDFPHPTYLTGLQWVVLAAVPLLSFAVAALAVNRYERFRHRGGRDRAAEQRGVTPG